MASIKDTIKKLFSQNKGGVGEKFLFGRKVLYTNISPYDENITAKISKEIGNVYNAHTQNQTDIQYLYDYYKGKQPVIYREKKVRPEINNKVVINRAYEIVNFKVGYLCGEPIQYVSRSPEEKISTEISILNDMMYSENKASKDEEIVRWDVICGTGYRMVLPNFNAQEDDSPFNIYTLDPRNTFVVYSNDYKKEPVYSGYITTKNEEDVEISVYTKNLFIVFDTNGKVLQKTPHALNAIPIIEYPANEARLGGFEVVLSALDAINTVESDRINGVSQFVQSLVKFINCDISETDFSALREEGAISVNSVEGAAKADVDILTQELNQDQTQTLIKDLYDAILSVCGMPSRNGNSSGGDTGAATILRDGWSLAEAVAKASETKFKESERSMLKIVLSICKNSTGIASEISDLKIYDIDTKFTRRNYENIQSKAQVLSTMLDNGKIHPRLAFEHCGMFSDPEDAFRMSEEYYKDFESKELASLAASEHNHDEPDTLIEGDDDDEEQEITE